MNEKFLLIYLFYLAVLTPDGLFGLGVHEGKGKEGKDKPCLVKFFKG